MWNIVIFVTLLASLQPAPVQLTSIDYKSVKISTTETREVLKQFHIPLAPNLRKQDEFLSYVDGNIFYNDSALDISIIIAPKNNLKPDARLSVVITSSSTTDSYFSIRYSSFLVKALHHDSDSTTYAVILGDILDSDTRDYRGGLDLEVVPESIRRARRALAKGKYHLSINMYLDGVLVDKKITSIRVIDR